MFNMLTPSKLSSTKQKARVFYYSGANASQMEQKLKKDVAFNSIDPKSVSKIFLLTGSNNVDDIYFGKRRLREAKEDIHKLLQYMKIRFVNSAVNIINILPRATIGRNHIIRELNLHIRELCKTNNFMFVDTESDHQLFTTVKGDRKREFFAVRGGDNVHLSKTGVVRLANHLKYLSHI